MTENGPERSDNMGRLIDADKNREDFKKTLYSILEDDSSTSKVKFNKIMTAFDSMPTAYSVDKVVEELEKLKDKGSVTKTEKLITKSCVDKAIKIVKQGSIRKDV